MVHRILEQGKFTNIRESPLSIISPWIINFFKPKFWSEISVEILETVRFDIWIVVEKKNRKKKIKNKRMIKSLLLRPILTEQFPVSQEPSG